MSSLSPYNNATVFPEEVSPPPPPEEVSPATNRTVSPPAPPPATTNATGIIIGTVLGSLCILIIGGIFLCFYRNMKRKRSRNNLSQEPQPKAPGVLVNQHQPSAGLLAPAVNSANTSSSFGSEKAKPYISPGISLGLSQSTFTYDELAMATDGFSKSNLLGQGGFGYVHKGVLPNGKIVAVKQLKSESRQGEREFHAEVEVISRVHHRHLVSLVGYSISDSQRMLVYEYVPNNTLEFHLHGKDRPPMDLSTRMKIAIGSGKGLAYLHEDCNPKIIHRDIKASNILLDNDFEAKVADFGLAKFSSDTETHVSTRVMGTFGYMAPEYASSGKLTEKSDVFSFGVVLLELITGRKPVDKTRPVVHDSMVEGQGLYCLKLWNMATLMDFLIQGWSQITILTR